jgi:hypothetical protein
MILTKLQISLGTVEVGFDITRIQNNRLTIVINGILIPTEFIEGKSSVAVSGGIIRLTSNDLIEIFYGQIIRPSTP